MKKLIPIFCMLIAACQGSGSGNEKQTETENPESQLLRSIQQYPDSLLLSETLIQLYRDSGLTEKALAETNRVLGRDSLLAGFWHIRAVLLIENGDTSASIQSLEKAVSADPHPRFLQALGILYAAQKKPESLNIADALLAGHQEKWEKQALLIKGMYHAAKGENKKAIVYFDQCIALSFSFMEAYREKAIALIQMKQYEEALSVLDKAIVIKNGFDEGHFYRGQCLEKLNRNEEAMEAYQTALLYDADYTEAKQALQALEKSISP